MWLTVFPVLWNEDSSAGDGRQQIRHLYVIYWFGLARGLDNTIHFLPILDQCLLLPYCFICWNGCWIFFIWKIRIKIKCAHYWIVFLVLFHKSDTVYSLKMVLSLCTIYIQTLFVRYHKTPAMDIIMAFFFIHKCLVHHTKLLVFIPTYLAQLLLVPPICFIVEVCHPLVCQ